MRMNGWPNNESGPAQPYPTKHHHHQLHQLQLDQAGEDSSLVGNGRRIHGRRKKTRDKMGRGGGMGNPVNVGIAVQADWENREFISNISLNVRRLFDFLIRFEATTKSKLASLNEKLDILERKLEVLEVQVSSATTNPSVFN